MPQPDLVVLAEGDLPAGQHWILKAGGARGDFYTTLETIHPDGHRDEGGMGGPPLYPGTLLNTYTGGSGRGLLRLVVRADPRVARVRVQLAGGELLDLPPLATGPISVCRSSPRCSPRPKPWFRSPPSAQTARCSSRRTYPGTRKAGDGSGGGAAIRRLELTWPDAPIVLSCSPLLGDTV